MKRKFITVALVGTFSVGAYANIDLSGFASIAAGKASLNEGSLTDEIDGYGEDFSFKDNSFVGIQATSDIGEGLGATVQIMSRGSNGYNLEVTWAFLSYDATDNWRILAGRQRMPYYSYSDYIDISYSYPWVKPPQETYNALFDSFSGISSIYTFEFENSSLSAQVLMGEESGDSVISVPGDDSVRAFDNIVGGKLTYSNNWLTLTAGHFDLTQTQSVDGIETVKGDMVIQDLGVQIDYNDWWIVAEATYTDLRELNIISTGNSIGLGTLEPWVLSVGKRFGNFLPHVSYGISVRDNFPVATRNYENPYSLIGLRWDFNSSAALKVEYSEVEDDRFGDGESFQVAIVTVF